MGCINFGWWTDPVSSSASAGVLVFLLISQSDSTGGVYGGECESKCWAPVKNEWEEMTGAWWHTAGDRQDTNSQLLPIVRLHQLPAVQQPAWAHGGFGYRREPAIYYLANRTLAVTLSDQVDRLRQCWNVCDLRSYGDGISPMIPSRIKRWSFFMFIQGRKIRIVIVHQHYS